MPPYDLYLDDAMEGDQLGCHGRVHSVTPESIGIVGEKEV